MKQYEQVTVIQSQFTGITCDRCKATATADDSESYAVMQEFVTVHGSGGYGSKFWGDGNRWHVDLCEKCQFELFADIAQNP